MEVGVVLSLALTMMMIWRTKERLGDAKEDVEN